MRLTCAMITKKMNAEGIPGQLCAGNGYFYLWDREGEDFWINAYTTSIYVCRLSHMSLERWMEEIRTMYQQLKLDLA
jgi:hypothetical protein